VSRFECQCSAIRVTFKLNHQPEYHASHGARAGNVRQGTRTVRSLRVDSESDAGRTSVKAYTTDQRIWRSDSDSDAQRHTGTDSRAPAPAGPPTLNRDLQVPPPARRRGDSESD
jgi:hypothetical protein